MAGHNIKSMVVSVWAVDKGKDVHYTVGVVAQNDTVACERAVKWALRQGQHVLSTTVISEQPYNL